MVAGDIPIVYITVSEETAWITMHLRKSWLLLLPILPQGRVGSPFPCCVAAAL